MRFRINILAILIFISFTVYASYLFYLQVIKGYIYSQRSEQISQREISIPPLRGDIYERTYSKILAGNTSSFNIYAIPKKFSINPAFLQQFQTTHMLDIPMILKQVKSHKKDNKIQVVGYDVPRKTVFFLAEKQAQAPGLYWQEVVKRVYPYGGMMSHILGYVGDITREEYQVRYNQGYSLNAKIGKSGVELIYDTFLKGTEGTYKFRADVRGASLTDKEIIKASQPGYDIVLSINLRIQELASKALGNRSGAVVVLNPENGEVLAMVSYPNFDPNIFSTHNQIKGFSGLSLDVRSPFLNRAIQTAVAPASTFKMVIATTLLQKSDFSPEQTIVCKGSIKIGNRIFHCWDPKGHGRVNLSQALAKSCNVYFYSMAVKHLTPKDIFETASQLSLGNKTGIDLPGENDGFIPTAEWKSATYHERWQIGDTANTAIGQGFTQVTPLQLATALSVIANKGYAYQPHLMKELRDHSSGQVVRYNTPKILTYANIPESVFERVQKGLRKVIVEGTARVVINTDAVDVAGKTGTGQTSSEEGFTSWFVAYAPYQDKQSRIVLAVMVDSSNKWEWWAPKAANIILEGIYTHATYEEAVKQLRKKKKLWYM